MTWLIDDEFWDGFATRALFHSTYGGADFGECRVAVDRFAGADPDHGGPDHGGPDEWFGAWNDLAEGLVAVGDTCAARGQAVSAREAYLRATNYFRTAYAPLMGAPVDPRLRAAFDHECDAFTKAAPLFDTPVELVEIPYEGGVTLPGIFVRADGSGRATPTIVHTNGYDSNVHEMFVAQAIASVARGWNILLFDGPGQGRTLVHDDLHIRPDWEHVVTPVIDWALGRPEVDPDRVVLAGWSFGGYLAPRAACFEHRIAALWADPGQWDQRTAVARLPLSDDDKAKFPDVDPHLLDDMENWLRGPDADPSLRWRLVQRGCWVHGVDTIYDLFRDMCRFELSPYAGDIECPTLLTMAEGDVIAAHARDLYDAIGSSTKELLQFTAAEGAGGHCEGTARRLFHQRCYDWLDTTLR
ncbi:MAG: alpha/beta fold hydrolase [Acidimicrobiia bacterium]